MHHTTPRITAIAIAVSTVFTLSTAHATNGYFGHGYGTKTKALAGAGVAHSQDSLAAATNPAGMVNVGDRLDVGAGWFHPSRGYTVTGNPSGQPGTFPLNPRTTDSNAEDFIIPHFGYNKMLSADMAVGVSVFGNGGMNTSYPAFANPNFCPPGTSATGSFCDGKAGIDLAQLFIAPTFSQKFASGQASWGVSAILAYQRFAARGIRTFASMSSDPQNLSNNGNDSSTGFGAKVGVEGEVAPGFKLGASYQSKVSMSEFDSYAGLFAEGGDFDIPSTWTVGLAWETTSRSTLVFDIQQINYSEIKAINNSIDKLQTQCQPTPPSGPGVGTGCLGASDGVGFGWDDMTIYKLGYEFATPQLADWTWRAGYSHNEQDRDFNNVTFNIFAPAVIKDHVTVGFTKAQGTNSEWSVAGMYAFKEKDKGPHAFDPAQQVELEMDQFEVEVSYGLKF